MAFRETWFIWFRCWFTLSATDREVWRSVWIVSSLDSRYWIRQTMPVVRLRRKREKRIKQEVINV
jgi:hypothetical protein